jgi:hypothetical protein
LIGGTFARAVFANLPTPSSLAIYVGTKKERDSIAEYVEYSGFSQVGQLEHEEQEDTNTNPKNWEVKGRYIKKTSQDKQLSIHIKYTPGRCSSVYNLLTSVCTTASLNFLSWNKAYALYPHTTFLKRDGYLLRRIDGGQVRSELLQESKQGFLPMSLHRSYDSDPIAGIRRVGDKKT